jgi:hypothetical protein
MGTGPDVLWTKLAALSTPCGEVLFARSADSLTGSGWNGDGRLCYATRGFWGTSTSAEAFEPGCSVCSVLRGT